MKSRFDWVTWYTARNRILCHIFFWALVSLLYYFSYSRIAGSQAWLFTLKDLFILTTVFYGTASFVTSRWLLNGKVLLVALWIVAAYVWWISITYAACMISLHFLPPTTDYLSRFLDMVTGKGFASLISLDRVPVFILDFFFLFSIPISPKVMKSLMETANDKMKLERDNISLELNFLKSQISPHFLFNTLNNLYYMANTGDKKTPETILRLADMMRYLLYESGKEKMPLKQEIMFINGYIELARIRYETLRVDCYLQPITEPYEIVPLLLIPFIENAFKHGPDRSAENSWINISVKVVDDVLHLKVANGMNEEAALPPAGGFGLETVKRRLQLHYPDRHSLCIYKSTKCFEIVLNIHLK